MFRSACPITPSEEDARILIDKLKIRHLVDLRSDYERRTDPVSPLLHCACIKQSQRYRGGLAEEVRPHNPSGYPHYTCISQDGSLSVCLRTDMPGAC